MDLLRHRVNAVFASIALTVMLLALSGCGDYLRTFPVAEPTPTTDPQTVQRAVEVNFNGGGQGTAVTIDMQADAVLGDFTTGAGPVSVTVNPNNTFFFTADQNGDSVTALAVLNPGGTPGTTITLPAGSRPSFITAPSNVTAFVANSGNGTIGVISEGLLALTQTVPVGANPVWIQANSGVSKIYVLNKGSGTVTVISTTDFSVLATLPVGASPIMAVSGPNGLQFVLNQGSNSFSVIDTVTDSVSAPIATGGNAPSFLAFDANLTRLYIVNTGSNSISVFKADANPPTLLKTVTVGSAPLAAAALTDGSRIYVANSGSNTVSVIDANSLSVTKTITVGAAPISIGAGTDSRRVIVLNRDSNNVSLIQTSNDTVVTNLPIAPGSNTPRALSVFSF